MKKRGRPRDRLKRPTPERTGPIRSWSSLLGGARADAPAADTPPGNKPPADSGVRRGVDFGYKVFEEYLQQGQSFARGLAPGAGVGAGAALADLPALTNRMFRYASDFASVWMEAMGTMVGGAAAKSAANAAPAANVAPAANAPAATAVPNAARREPTADARAPPKGVVLRLASSRPAEISIVLDDAGAGARLGAADLQARRGKGRIGPVVVTYDRKGERVTFQVSVAAGVPRGVYTGAIVDQETGRRVGALKVRILA